MNELETKLAELSEKLGKVQKALFDVHAHLRDNPKTTITAFEIACKVRKLTADNAMLAEALRGTIADS